MLNDLDLLLNDRHLNYVIDTRSRIHINLEEGLDQFFDVLTVAVFGQRLVLTCHYLDGESGQIGTIKRWL